MMIGRTIAALGLIGLLAGCTSERVVLLPNDDGSSGSVAIFSDDGKETAELNQPYTEASVGFTGVASVSETDAQAVQSSYGTLLEGLPTPPKSFTLYFKEGTTTLIPISEPELQELFQEVNDRTGADVQVVGHTDTVGLGDNNDVLSLARAREIKRLLIDRGMAAGMIRAVGRGERELLVETDDEVSEPKNRRVEVLVR